MNGMTPAFAEEAVIGGLLLDNMRLHDVAAIVSPEHFTGGGRGQLFMAIKQRVLAGEPADTVTIGEMIPDLFDYAIHLASNVPGASQVVAYAQIVRANWRKREAMQIALRLQSGIKGDDDGVVDRAISELLDLSATVVDCEHTGKQAMQQAWREVAAAHANGGALSGIPTGIEELDEILGGWHDSDLTIIGGRPAMGKTAFLGGLVEACAAAGYKPGLFSAEQPAIQMAKRRLSMLSGVPATKLRTGDIHEADWSKLQVGMQDGLAREMMIYDRSAITLDELISTARKWKHTHGIKAIFIDYAQRITIPGADRISEVSKIARGLKNLARDLNIPIIALGQVKATVESRNDKRPLAGDLANSDELVREADQIIMLYRDEVYNRESTEKGIAEALIEKNRHGPTGFKRIRFDSSTMTFSGFKRPVRSGAMDDDL